MNNKEWELCEPETMRAEMRQRTHEMMMMENRPGNKTRGGEPRQSESMKENNRIG
jgi:hypothetical protein